MQIIPLLVDLAARSGLTNEEECFDELESASRVGASLIETLMDSDKVQESVFMKGLADRLGMEYLKETEIESERSIHDIFPAKLALRYRVLPGRLHGNELTLMTYDPFDVSARQAIGVEYPHEVKWVVSSRHYIMESLRERYGVGAENFEELIEDRENFDSDESMNQEVNILDEDADEEATVIAFMNQIFREALDQRATDIHIEPLEKDLRIRYRIDGALQEVAVPPNVRVLQSALVSRLKIMANLDIAERRLPQDGRIPLELEGSPIDVRVATIPSVNGESVSLRLLRRENFDFDKLQLEPELADQIRRLLKTPNGIILVTGPTGSGKSTTLYTFLKILNKNDTRIVTVEDPVENKLDGVVQIAVKPEIDLTFASGLRSILRGDPNIIMVGEMRDIETTEIAVRGALTGHLVFSTLHTNDAVGGISRLVDMGVEPFLISSSVRAFLAQRLVRTLCPHCSELVVHSDEYLDSINFPQEGRDGLRKAVGCRECRQSGYKGRLAIMEVCEMSQGIGSLVTTGADANKIRAVSVNEGMVPMRQYGWQKCIKGITTIEEVITATAADEE